MSSLIERIAIVGTGLIGTSTALALRRAGFHGRLIGIDKEIPREFTRETADATLQTAFDELLAYAPGTTPVLAQADVILLAVPVLAILDWMQQLAPILNERQLVTDVGSTKLEITLRALQLFNQPGRARFLPGHPMAGKERGGANLADPELFENAVWLFTPLTPEPSPLEAEWRALVERMGARTLDLDPTRHDELCAWVSHLPQMVATAMAALFEDTFGQDEASRAEIAAIGGRALREMTRLGASPYTMWRDVALTNTAPVADTLHALEQRLAHLRENLRTPELRDEFLLANNFRARS